MLQATTLQFLKKLSQNNNKEWMDANRKMYLDAKTNFEDLVTAIIAQLEVVGIPSESITAKSCIFRLNRDVRFSTNKEPYKNNFGAAFSNGGKKSVNAGYYLHLEPGKSFLAAGMWMPDAAVLQKVRQEIDYNFSEFESIIHHKKFVATVGTVNGDKLKNPPKGYTADNPAIEYLKYKSFTIGKPLTDEVILNPKVSNQIIKDFEIMQDFVHFLNRALD